jgi:hypothetical protein
MRNAVNAPSKRKAMISDRFMLAKRKAMISDRFMLAMTGHDQAA